jgi:hypothetical protein
VTSRTGKASPNLEAESVSELELLVEGRSRKLGSRSGDGMEGIHAEVKETVMDTVARGYSHYARAKFTVGHDERYSHLGASVHRTRGPENRTRFLWSPGPLGEIDLFG